MHHVYCISPTSRDVSTVAVDDNSKRPPSQRPPSCAQQGEGHRYTFAPQANNEGFVSKRLPASLNQSTENLFPLSVPPVPPLPATAAKVEQSSDEIRWWKDDKQQRSALQQLVHRGDAGPGVCPSGQPYCSSSNQKKSTPKPPLGGSTFYDSYIAGSGASAVATMNQQSSKKWFEVGLDDLSKTRPPPSAPVQSAPIVGDSASLLSAIQIQVSMLMEQQNDSLRGVLHQFQGRIDDSLSVLERRVNVLEITCQKVESMVSRELSEARDERNALSAKLMAIQEARDQAAIELRSHNPAVPSGTLRAQSPAGATAALQNIVDAASPKTGGRPPSASGGLMLQKLMEAVRNATPPVGAAATAPVSVENVAPAATKGPDPVTVEIPKQQPQPEVSKQATATLPQVKIVEPVTKVAELPAVAAAKVESSHATASIAAPSSLLGSTSSFVSGPPKSVEVIEKDKQEQSTAPAPAPATAAAAASNQEVSTKTTVVDSSPPPPPTLPPANSVPAAGPAGNPAALFQKVVATAATSSNSA